MKGSKRGARAAVNASGSSRSKKAAKIADKEAKLQADEEALSKRNGGGGAASEEEDKEEGKEGKEGNEASGEGGGAVEALKAESERKQVLELQSAHERDSRAAFLGYAWFRITFKCILPNKWNECDLDPAGVAGMAASLKVNGIHYFAHALPRLAVKRSDITTDLSTLPKEQGLVVGNGAGAVFKSNARGIDFLLNKQGEKEELKAKKVHMERLYDEVTMWPFALGRTPPSLWLSKNETDVRVAETEKEGWLNALTANDSYCWKEYGGARAAINMSRDDLLKVASRKQAFSGLSSELIKTVPYIAIFVLRLHLLSPSFAEFVSSPKVV
ncbi:hypothetical protein PENSPDRAFT_672364, partial [Peniophora sp. CONT]